MPRQNKKSNRQRRRKNQNNRRRRNFNNNKTSSISVGPAVVPDRVVVNLKYTTILSRSPGTATDEYIFTGNGPFDPDVTGTGGQPVGYDQWCNFYGRQLTLSSKIRIKVIDNSSTTNVAICVFPTDTTGGVSTFVDAASQPYSRWQIATFSGGMSKLSINNSISTSKIWGKNCHYDDLFTSTTGSVPSNLWYWVINADASPGSAAVYTLYVEVIYRILFFKRVAFDLSILKTKKVPPTGLWEDSSEECYPNDKK